MNTPTSASTSSTDGMTGAEIADRLIALAREAGAEAADAIAIEETGISVGVSAGALEEAERSEGRDYGLRVLIGQRQAVVSASDPKPEALAEMAERAVAIAREAPEDPYAGLADVDQITAMRDTAPLDLIDNGAPWTPADLERLARAGEEAALAVSGITQVEQAAAATGDVTLSLAASNGFHGSYRRTTSSVVVSAIAGEGLGRERDYAFASRCHRSDLDSAEEIGTKAGERTVERLAPRKPPGGAFPVLYDERVASSLIGHLLSASNGSSIARGSSWLRDAKDSAVLPDTMTVTEDPLIARMYGSRPFDAEGIATARRDIVSNGILTGWVLDLATARQLGLTTTGNARRSVSGTPSPGVTNIRLAGPVRPKADLIRDMGTGLVVTSMIGSSISATTGAYSRGASGFWVEGGEIAYPVNEITIAGTLPDMLRTLIAADDADPMKAYSVPSLLVEGLTIGA